MKYSIQLTEYEFQVVEAASLTLQALTARVQADRERFAAPSEPLKEEACRTIARVMRSALSHGNVRVIHESEAAE